MTTQLFDLFRQFKNDTTNAPTFLMRAPIDVIMEFLDSQAEAKHRVLDELEQGEPVSFMHNDRRYPGLVHVIGYAVGIR